MENPKEKNEKESQKDRMDFSHSWSEERTNKKKRRRRRRKDGGKRSLGTPLRYPLLFRDPFSPAYQELPLIPYLVHSGKLEELEKKRHERGGMWVHVPGKLLQELKKFVLLQSVHEFHQRIMQMRPLLQRINYLKYDAMTTNTRMSPSVTAMASVAKKFDEVGNGLYYIADKEPGFCSNTAIDQMAAM